MVIKYIYITENSKKLAESLCLDTMKGEEIDGEKLTGETVSFKEFKKDMKNIFDNSDFLVFIMAAGIAVRTIAGLLKSKFTDPGIVVMDEYGKNIISLLSGHIGGANELTEILAGKTGGNPVITTATDVNKKGSLDMIIKKLGASQENIREISLEINSKILKGEKINLFVQKEYMEYIEKYTSGFNIVDSIDEFISELEKSRLGLSQERFIIITDRADYIEKTDRVSKDAAIKIIPVKNVMGTGCRKSTSSVLYEKEVLKYLSENNLLIESIGTISSIDIKKNEKCIQDFADKYGIETKFFTAEELSKVDGKYEKSDFVKKTVGVYSVAEPSCDLLCGGNIITDKHKADGITISVGRIK